MIYIAIGILSGIMSGLGIGGGTILIPALIFFCEIEQKSAQQLNLLYFIPTAIIAILVHSKNKNVEKHSLKFLILFGILGTILGSVITLNLNNQILSKFFGIFLLIMGMIEFKKS